MTRLTDHQWIGLVLIIFSWNVTPIPGILAFVTGAYLLITKGENTKPNMSYDDKKEE